MVLERQLVDIPLAGGQHEETDERLMAPDQFYRLTNCVHDRKRGVLSKRYGYTKTPAVTGSTSLVKVMASEDELIAINDDNTVVAVSRVLDSFVSRAHMPEAAILTRNVARELKLSPAFDVEICNNIVVYAFTRNLASDRVFLRVVDYVTGKTLREDFAFSTNIPTRLVKAGNNIIAIYTDGMYFKYRILLCSLAGVAAGWGPLVSQSLSGEATPDYWDVCEIPGVGCAIVCSAGIAGHWAYKLSDQMVILAQYSNISKVTDAMGCCYGSGVLYYGYLETDTGNLVARYLDVAGWVVGGGTLLDAPTEAVHNIGLCARSGGGVWYFADEEGSSDDGRELTRTYALDDSCGVDSGPHVTYRAYLLSRPFEYDGRVYVVTRFESTDGLQDSAFLQCFSDNTYTSLSTTGRVVGTIKPRQIRRATIFDSSALCRVITTATGVYRTLVAEMDNKLSEAIINFADNSLKWDPAVHKKSLYLSAGVPVVYDGKRITETVPQVWPDAFAIAIVEDVGANVPPGDYYYCFVYEWRTEDGRVVQSAPSSILKVTISLAGTAPQCTVACLHPTLTQESEVCAVLVPYRTVVDGSVLYRVYDDVTAVELQNSHASAVATWTDSRPSATDTDYWLAQRASLNLSLLPNVCPPSAQVAHIHKNRLFLGCDTELWFSRYILDGEGPSFADQQVIDTGSGPITGLATLGTSLIIFKGDRVLRLDGEGPADDGTQSDYGDPIIVSTAVGCSDARTVCETPVGVVFQWEGTVCVLTPNGQVEDVGGAMQDTLTTYSTISSVSCVPTQDSVFFTVDNGSAGRVLCWNYATNTWAVHAPKYAANTYFRPTSGCSYNGTHCFTSPAYGYIWQQDTAKTPFRDNGTIYIPMSFETSWIRTGQLNGALKLRKLLLFAEEKDASSVTISTAFDYNPTYSWSNTWARADVQAQATGPYLHLEAPSARQRCESFRVKVEETDPTAATTTGEGYVLVRLTAEVASKPGLYKFKPTDRKP